MDNFKIIAIFAVFALLLFYGCESSAENERERSYQNGYEEGHTDGYNEGYEDGYNAGHDIGVEDGQEEIFDAIENGQLYYQDYSFTD